MLELFYFYDNLFYITSNENILKVVQAKQTR